MRPPPSQLNLDLADAGLRKTFGIDALYSAQFFTDPHEIDERAPRLRAQEMRRAWTELGLSAILCLDGKPTAYFRESPNIAREDVRTLQKLAWNQGSAPLLVLIDGTDVHIYSSLAYPASGEQPPEGNGRLVQSLRRVAEALEIRQILSSVETGDYFRQHAESFDPKRRVDRYLLDNLSAARHQLREANTRTLDIRSVHALLWRVVFTCYLFDRTVIDADYFASCGVPDTPSVQALLLNGTPQEASAALYRVFARLKQDFNGDLFDTDLAAEERGLSSEHIRILRAFVRGDQLDRQQLSLGFWAYDFSVIPIETISAIYESFLEAEDESEKKEAGAYYTPRFLAELVIEIALENWGSLLGKRFLDPACGSGIFLVGIFNCLAEEWRRIHGGYTNEELYAGLRQILSESLYGTDVNESACRISAFSLYLALLDQLNPRDIRDLQSKGRALPRLISAGRGEDENYRHLACVSFFAPGFPFAHQSFDLVIGNPPWKRAKASDAYEWCQAQEPPLPCSQGQIASAFVWKAPQHIGTKGRVCLVLPAGLMLQSESREFQVEWLSRFTVERVVNLSDMRFYLFEKAVRPALIARYTPAKPDPRRHGVAYAVPKTDVETLKAETVRITSDDEELFRLDQVLAALGTADEPNIWKVAMWASPRDRKFIDRLLTLPRLARMTAKGSERPPGDKRWVISQGFQPMGPNDKPRSAKPRPWDDDMPFLPGRSQAIKLIIVEQDTRPIADHARFLRRLPPKEDIFRAPHVIVTKGLRAAFAGFDVVFQHALHGIHGPPQDQRLLMFLAAVLDSDLARYFFFHTAMSWGTERDAVLEDELLGLPFPLPEESNADDRWGLVSEVANIMAGLSTEVRSNPLGRSGSLEDARTRIRRVVFEYYGVGPEEQSLIEDTLSVYEPSSTPRGSGATVPTLLPSTQDQREQYVDLLCAELNEWATGGPYRVSGRAIASAARGVGLAIIERTPPSGHTTSPSEEELILDALDRMQKSVTGDGRKMDRIRDIKLFSGDRLYILKSLQQRFWTKSSALNDADEIAAAILSAEGRR